jgi:hypothetical protein
MGMSLNHTQARNLHRFYDRTPIEIQGIRRLKIDPGILNKVRMRKHAYEAYKDMIKIEIKLLQLCLKITR